MQLLNSFRNTLILSMIFVAVFAIGLVGVFWISQEYSKFEEESKQLRSAFLDQQKTLIRREVNRVVDYIDYQRSIAETSLEIRIKERVDQAWDVATALHDTYKDSKTPEDIQAMIRETLRDIRFDRGRGYYFIYDMEGFNILLPPTPELEGKNLRDLQDSEGLYTIRRFIFLMEQQGEGYLRWHWFKPGETARMSEKIGYSRIFAPYDWWIGTDDYIEDIEQEIQARTLAWINTIRYDEDGYIFVYDFEANTLAHYKPENLGINQWNFRDPDGIPVLQELIGGCRRQEDGIFLQYVATIRPVTGLPAYKLSYARAIPAWEWMVGTGVYMDEINAVLKEKRAELDAKVVRNFGVIAAILALSLGCLAFIARLITSRIAANTQGFVAFFEQAATGSKQIDDQAIHFTEFKGLALAANRMIEERMQAESAVAALQEQLIGKATENALINKEMQLARKIQTSLLPHLTDHFHPDFEIVAEMLPADQVGGDFYEITLDGSGHLRFAVGDVSGHGITPGLIMMMAQTVHATVTTVMDCDARDVVIKTNEILYKNVHNRLNERHFMTFTALKYLGDGRFQHAGAHLSLIVFRRKTGICEFIGTRGVYLNLKKDISRSTQNAEFYLDYGDILVLYTDGLTEAENSRGEMLDLDGFAKTVEKHAHLIPQNMKDKIMADVIKWCDNKRADDMSIVIIKRKEDGYE